ncbi:MAG TPA: hypothetical protein VFW40_09755 [Capsulimonadaceae bacterium]|nr:hypothetical protein [Capsulimonadaceae bacterium]
MLIPSTAQSATDPIDSAEDFAWLRSIPAPRPFVWQSLVYKRRAAYGLLALLLFVIFEGWPERMSLVHMGYAGTWRQDIHLDQVPLFMGMLVVVAFVGTCYALYKQYDDSKWLARNGEIGEANLLSVQNAGKQLLISYHFWDAKGNEIEREAIIASEKNELPDLCAGDIVPVLYDRARPARRNLLWPEIARYVEYKAETEDQKTQPV